MGTEWILVVLVVPMALFWQDLDRLLGKNRELKRVLLTFAGGLAALGILMTVVSLPS